MLAVLDRPVGAAVVVDEFEASRDCEFTDDLVERAAVYAMEQRFDTTFWRRRRLDATVDRPVA